MSSRRRSFTATLRTATIATLVQDAEAAIGSFGDEASRGWYRIRDVSSGSFTRRWPIDWCGLLVDGHADEVLARRVKRTGRWPAAALVVLAVVLCSNS